MGRLEAESRRARRIGHVQKALLTAAVIGGIMLIGGVLNPSTLNVLGGRRNKYKFKYQAASALGRLAKKRYVTFASERGRTLARITPAGRKALVWEEQKAALQLQKKKRWDKKWRVVIFDIPEYRRGTRNQLRMTMQNAGFYRLQNSVWLYPYDCEDFVALLKADLKIGRAVLYMIVDKIENDEKLKENFVIP